MKDTLALLGGDKTINKTFERFNTYDQNEVEAATAVVQEGVLSKYLGCWHEDFYGGPRVRAFERQWSDYFKVKHSVAYELSNIRFNCCNGGYWYRAWG